MTDEELKTAQALGREIDRGFPSIPQSQLDDLIPLEGLDDEEKETEYKDKVVSENKVIYDWANAEEAAKIIAEVRREGYEAGVNDERLTHVPGWEDWMQGHAKGYVEGLEAAAKAMCEACRNNCILEEIPDGNLKNRTIFVHKFTDSGYKPTCPANAIHQLRVAAEQGQGEESSRKG